MSNVLPNVVAVAAMLAGGLVALCVIVLFFAGMANSSPGQLRFMTRLVWIVAIGTAAAVAAAIALMIYGKPWPAAIVGGAPAVIGIVMVIVMAQLGV